MLTTIPKHICLGSVWCSLLFFHMERLPSLDSATREDRMKRSPLRRVSKRRAKENKEYSRLRLTYLGMFPICERCKKSESVHIHHTNGRFKERLNDTKHWKALCFECHMFVHHNPSQAKNEGYFL